MHLHLQLQHRQSYLHIALCNKRVFALHCSAAAVRCSASCSPSHPSMVEKLKKPNKHSNGAVEINKKKAEGILSSMETKIHKRKRRYLWGYMTMGYW